MIGGAIKSDTVIHTVGSQTDVANTLLGQLGQEKKEFRFSKNLMSNQVKPFAMYFFNDGYGYVAPNKYLIYDNTGNQFVKNEGASNIDMDATKAYQQTLYSDYNQRDK